MNRSVLPASCRQKKLGSADETSAARWWGYVLLYDGSWLRCAPILKVEAFDEPPACGKRFGVRRQAKRDAAFELPTLLVPH